MKYTKNNPPLVCMMTNSTNYKNADIGKMVGVCWHSTGANNKTLKRYCQPSPNDTKYNELISLIGKNNNRNDWNTTEVWAGVNAWIGTLADGSVTTLQTLPWNVAPWGVASGWRGSLNWFDGKFYGQFEICEDSLNDKSYFEKVYKEGCELTAYLCLIHNINPKGYVEYKGAKMPTIMCHRDSYDYGMGSSHSDVRHWFNKYGKTMDDVRNDVAKLLNGSTSSTTPTITSEPIYRVRKTWDDAKSQKGAYKNLNSAKSTCDKHVGYSVFDEKGNVVYTAKATSTIPTAGQMYRIRKTWSDAKSQKGAYRNLEFAKTECNKYDGYSVFDESGNIVYTAPVKAIIPNITYAVKTKNHGILPDVKNRTDCAGYGNSEIVAVKIGVDSGSIKYRVHTVAGKWLGWITKANWNDYHNGYAGDDKTAIDAIEVIYYTDVTKTGGKYYKACYQVRAKGNSSYWTNQLDNEKKNGMDGYAGSFGTPIVELKMSLIN